MSRSKRIIATCALTMGTLGFLATPAMAHTPGPAASSDHHTTGGPDRSSTHLTLAADTHPTGLVEATERNQS